MLNTLNVNLNTDLKVSRAPELGIKIKSQDINNNLFILRFTDKGKAIELDETYTVEILTKFEKSKSHRLTSATVYRDYARWEFDTSFITQDEKVTNYVYVRKSGSLVVSADANAFAFDVGLSEIDKDAGRVAEVYDENYQKYLDEFKDNVDFEEIAQAEQARKEAEILRQESYEAKVDTAIVEADVVEKVDNKVTELTPQINNLTAQLEQTIKKGEIVLNVKDFGAVGDGVTDDTQSFKELSLFCKNKKGVRIIIPSGTYIIGEPITLTISNSAIDNFGVLKVKNGIITPYGFFTINGDGVTVNGLNIDGNEQNVVDEEMFGASSLLNIVGNSKHVVFNNSEFKNSIYSCITMGGGSENVTFNNTHFENIGEHCFYISGNGGTNGVHINNSTVINFGMHNVHGRQSDAVHFSGFVKTRTNTTVNNENINITGLRVVNEPLSKALYIIGSQGLGSGICRDVDGGGLALISLTGAIEDVIYTFDNCINVTMSYGGSQHKYAISFLNCDFLPDAPSQIFNVNAYNCKFEFASNSNTIIAPNQSMAFSVLHEKCTYIFNGRGINFDNPLYNKDLIFNDCVFNNTSTNSAMMRLYQYESGSWIFNNCKVEGVSTSFIRNYGGELTVLNTTFHDCVSVGFLSELPNSKYFNCQNIKYIGLTSERPSGKNMNKGFNYFDTSLNKPIWWTGTSWVDSSGTTV